jgi:hypothetical protein
MNIHLLWHAPRLACGWLLWLLLLLAVFVSSAANAGGLADRFRDFILGDEAQAKSALPGLDASARACLQCHDGSHAPPVAGRAAGSPLQIRGSQTLNHPIGMVYDQSVMRDPQGYKSRAALHPNIRFVDGQVSCVSCHQTRTDLTLAAASDVKPQLTNASTCTATKELTVGRRDRDLCLACHNK